MMQIAKKYLTWQRPLFKKSIGAERYQDLPLNSIVFAVDEHIENDRQMVEYRGITGWVEVEYLDHYTESLSKDCVDLSDLQTPSDTDAQQYIMIGSKRVVNACGMISISYLLGISLSVMLEAWRTQSPNHYRIVDRSNWLTSSDDLVMILESLGKDAEKLRLKRYTPSNITGGQIVAVTINSTTGRLDTTGVRHWVVPVSVWQDRQGYGTIDLYNPFPNRRERYSWTEFVKSAGIVSGVVTKTPHEVGQ